MFNNSRDALGIALMYLGCSLNTTDRDELRQAADLIIAAHRKPCAFERTRYLPCVVEVSLALCKRCLL